MNFYLICGALAFEITEQIRLCYSKEISSNFRKKFEAKAELREQAYGEGFTKHDEKTMVLARKY